jgi:hypothetical protein
MAPAHVGADSQHRHKLSRISLNPQPRQLNQLEVPNARVRRCGERHDARSSRESIGTERYERPREK